MKNIVERLKDVSKNREIWVKVFLVVAGTALLTLVILCFFQNRRLDKALDECVRAGVAGKIKELELESQLRSTVSDSRFVGNGVGEGGLYEEDGIPEPDFDWNIPTLPELPEGMSWHSFPVEVDEAHGETLPHVLHLGTSRVQSYKDLLPSGTMYYSGRITGNDEYSILSAVANAAQYFGWKYGVAYKGNVFWVGNGGSGSGVFDGYVKSNGNVIRSIRLTNRYQISGWEIYFFVSDPINMDDYIK